VMVLFWIWASSLKQLATSAKKNTDFINVIMNKKCNTNKMFIKSKTIWSQAFNSPLVTDTFYYTTFVSTLPFLLCNENTPGWPLEPYSLHSVKHRWIPLRQSKCYRFIMWLWSSLLILKSQYIFLKFDFSKYLAHLEACSFNGQ
jgi:hypothetical protein